MKKIFSIFLIAILLLPNYASATRMYSSGFENNNSTEQGDSGASYGSFNTGTVRSGTYSNRHTGFASGTPQHTGQQYSAANSDSQYFLRFYFRVATSPSAENRIAAFANTTPAYLAWITIDASNVLRLYDEDGQITGTTTLTANTWYRIEMRIYRPASNHTVEAEVDGTVFATDSTRALSSGTSRFRLGANLGSEAQTTGDWFFDDVALNNTAGSAQTGYPGDGKIVHLRPNAAGDNAMGSRGGSDSGSDYGQVDEVTPNDATDYYVLDANNDILDVNLQPSSTPGIGSSDTITLVQVGSKSRPATAASMTVNLRIKSQASGTVLSGSSEAHNDTGWKYHGKDALPRIYGLTSYTDPQAGGAWTASLLDTTQIGAIATDADPDYWVTSLWALVEYVPAVAGSRRIIITD